MHAHCSCLFLFPLNHNLWYPTWCDPKPVELHGCFSVWPPHSHHFPPAHLCPSHHFPQAWTRASLLIWTGLQIAECLWTNPVSPSTETDLWTALLGPDVCICFTSCVRAVSPSLCNPPLSSSLPNSAPAYDWKERKHWSHWVHIRNLHYI